MVSCHVYLGYGVLKKISKIDVIYPIQEQVNNAYLKLINEAGSLPSAAEANEIAFEAVLSRFIFCIY